MPLSYFPGEGEYWQVLDQAFEESRPIRVRDLRAAPSPVLLGWHRRVVQAEYHAHEVRGVVPPKYIMVTLDRLRMEVLRRIGDGNDGAVA